MKTLRSFLDLAWRLGTCHRVAAQGDGSLDRTRRGLRRPGLSRLSGLMLVWFPALAAAQPTWGDFIYTTNANTATITGYTGGGGAVTIPATVNGIPVTSIGDSAFYVSTNLTSLVIPDGIGSIGSAAFYGCSSLTNAAIGDSVTNLGSLAFENCPALATLVLGNGVTTIGDSAFSICSSLAGLTLPQGVTSLGDEAFYRCSLLTNVTLPRNVAHLGAGVFAACQALTNLTVDTLNTNYISMGGLVFDYGQTTLVQYPAGQVGSYTLPAGVTAIASGAFNGAERLTGITIPHGVTSIGVFAFDDCLGLTNVTLPGTVTNLDLAFSDCDWLVSATLLNGIPTTGNGTFQYCYRLVSVTLPDSITEVGDSAFDGCSSLAEITLPNSVTRLGTSAFYWCGSLTNLTLPDHVQSLGTFVFGSCSGLTGLTIPASVTNIGVGACLFCNNLKAITVNPLNRYYRSVDGVLFDYSQTTLLQFPGGKTGAYTIPTGVTIGDNSFMGAVGIASITIPDGVTALDNFVFASTANLTNATIYDSVTNLADGAFQNCPSLRAVYFTGPPPNLGSQVFAGDNQAKFYFIPGTGAWGTTFGGLPTLPWNGLPPIITAGPQSVLTNLGAAVRFTVSAGGTWLNYQWLFNGAPILGATSSGYTLTNAQLPNAGLYAVVVSNALGSATSATADLTITFPHTALANALVMSGFVVQVTVTDGGWGYTNPPLVEIVGGGGSGAQAVAVLANGQIVAIDILDAGFGYTDTPQILIAPPFIPPATLGLVPLTLLSFTNLTPGLGYQLQTFNSSTWFNRGTNFTAANSGFAQMVSGTIAPNGWRLALTPVPTQAQAVAQVFNGFVIGATVTSGGSGYTTNPAVTIVSNGAGSNATATATVANGAVAAVHIQHAGNGYTVSPSILIEPPPVIALSPTVTQVMELELGNLSSWGSYQLQSAPTPAGPWSDLGAPFTAAAATNTQYIGVSGSVGFFRVVYVP